MMYRICVRLECRGEGNNTLRVYKVDDSIVLEDVDFFNAGNSIDAQPLQSALQPLVVSCGGLVHGLFFPEHERITFFPQKVTRKKKVFFFTNYNTKNACLSSATTTQRQVK